MWAMRTDNTGSESRSTGGSFVERLLDEQQDLSVVERFAQRHDDHQSSSRAEHYRDLIPLTQPTQGEQYAFDVNLDACTGCKACVTACHNLNGLDDEEAWRDVGLIHGGTLEDPVLQTITTACHHCLEPACMKGCPAGAYEKDTITGIVKHLDDKCIGCQYCLLACPYDVPKYNKSRGIVRKCDMCTDRLALGEAPACVQACPSEAIRITTVKIEETLEDAEANFFLPGAPDPALTLPTTRYRTERAFPRNTLPADYFDVSAEHAHGPLVVMLVLTQMSVGAFLVGTLLRALVSGHVLEAIRPFHSISPALLGAVALGASVFHLGKPQRAYRALVGLRSSWLSREIAAFGLFAASAGAFALYPWVLRLTAIDWSWQERILETIVVASGLAGVLCSVMVYHVTRRELWKGFPTAIRFLATTLLLGMATTLITSVLTASLAGSLEVGRVMTAMGYDLCRAIVIVTVCKLLFELLVLRHLTDRRQTLGRRTATLLVGALGPVTFKRFVFGLLGGVVVPVVILAQGLLGEGEQAGAMFTVSLACFSLVLILSGELMERYLFFRAVVSRRMPRGVV